MHHIVPWKIDAQRGKLYEYIESVTDVFHSICDTTTMWMRRLGVSKRIITIPIWNNENVWRKMDVVGCNFIYQMMLILLALNVMQEIV